MKQGGAVSSLDGGRHRGAAVGGDDGSSAITLPSTVAAAMRAGGDGALAPARMLPSVAASVSVSASQPSSSSSMGGVEDLLRLLQQEQQRSVAGAGVRGADQQQHASFASDGLDLMLAEIEAQLGISSSHTLGRMPHSGAGARAGGPAPGGHLGTGAHAAAIDQGLTERSAGTESTTVGSAGDAAAARLGGRGAKGATTGSMTTGVATEVDTGGSRGDSSTDSGGAVGAALELALEAQAVLASAAAAAAHAGAPVGVAAAGSTAVDTSLTSLPSTVVRAMGQGQGLSRGVAAKPAETQGEQGAAAAAAAGDARAAARRANAFLLEMLSLGGSEGALDDERAGPASRAGAGARKPGPGESSLSSSLDTAGAAVAAKGEGERFASARSSGSMGAGSGSSLPTPSIGTSSSGAEAEVAGAAGRRRRHAEESEGPLGPTEAAFLELAGASGVGGVVGVHGGQGRRDAAAGLGGLEKVPEGRSTGVTSSSTSLPTTIITQLLSATDDAPPPRGATGAAVGAAVVGYSGGNSLRSGSCGSSELSLPATVEAVMRPEPLAMSAAAAPKVPAAAMEAAKKVPAGVAVPSVADSTGQGVRFGSSGSSELSLPTTVEMAMLPEAVATASGTVPAAAAGQVAGAAGEADQKVQEAWGARVPVRQVLEGPAPIGAMPATQQAHGGVQRGVASGSAPLGAAGETLQRSGAGKPRPLGQQQQHLAAGLLGTIEEEEGLAGFGASSDDDTAGGSGMGLPAGLVEEAEGKGGCRKAQCCSDQ